MAYSFKSEILAKAIFLEEENLQFFLSLNLATSNVEMLFASYQYSAVVGGGSPE